MWPGKWPGSSNAVTPAASSVSPPISSKSTDGDRPFDVRPVAVARERDAVAVRDVARVREDERAVTIGVPADVIDVQVRQEDDVDVVRRDAGRRERGQQPLLPLRRPAPEPRRPDAGVDERRSCRRSESGTRCTGAATASRRRARDRALVYGIPVRRVREELVQLPEQADRVDERHELDRRRLPPDPRRRAARRAPPASRSPGCAGRRSARSRPRSRRPASGRATPRPREKPATPRHRPGREHVACRVAERRVVDEDLRDRHAHPARVRLLPRLAVDAQLHRQVVRVGDLVRASRSTARAGRTCRSPCRS